MSSIKFNKNIKDYEYFLSFDLATKITGWSLMRGEWVGNVKDDFSSLPKSSDLTSSDILNPSLNTPSNILPLNGWKWTLLESGILDSSKYNIGGEDTFFYDQYKAFVSVIKNVVTRVGKEGSSTNSILVLKERLPNQAGSFSTIATLQSLSQTHAIFQLALERSGLDYYDNDGVHSVSVKAFFSAIMDMDKPSKEDIRNGVCKYVVNSYDRLDTNITDSIAVVLTLVSGSKWNKDIKDEIKEIKKIIKSGKYKSNKKIDELNNNIKNLEDLLI